MQKTTSIQLVPSEDVSSVPHVSAKAAAASMERFSQVGNRLTVEEEQQQKGNQVPSDYFDVNLASSDEEDTMEEKCFVDETVSWVLAFVK